MSITTPGTEETAPNPTTSPTPFQELDNDPEHLEDVSACIYRHSKAAHRRVPTKNQLKPKLRAHQDSSENLSEVGDDFFDASGQMERVRMTVKLSKAGAKTLKRLRNTTQGTVKRTLNRPDYTKYPVKNSSNPLHDDGPVATLEIVSPRKTEEMPKQNEASSFLLESQTSQIIEEGMEPEQPDKPIYSVDVLWENQRGFVIFGAPKFAAAALLQFDMGAWTDEKLNTSPYTIVTHPVPNPQWIWDSTWMVDMSGDVDEAGWSYALRFRSTHWRGAAEGHRSFVRRRRWIRGRIFQGAPKKMIDSPPDWTALRIGYLDSLRNEEYPLGPLTCISLLPVSDDMKTLVLRNDASLEHRFVSWEIIQEFLFNNPIVPPNPGHEDIDIALLEKSYSQATVLCNLHLAISRQKGCRMDREKLNLWRSWLQQDEKAGRQQLDDLETIFPFVQVNIDYTPVWEVLEHYVDVFFALLEFAQSKESFKKLLIEFSQYAEWTGKVSFTNRLKRDASFQWKI